MRRPGTRAYAFASVAVALAIVVGALATTISSNTTTESSATSSSSSSATTSSTSSTSSVSQSFEGNCLIPVQPGANITLQTSSGTPGALVSNSSGQAFYPENMCPQPVSNKTYEFGANFPNAVTWVPTSNYQLALAAVSNSKFISLEDGATYIYSQPGSSSLSSSDDNSLVMGPTNGTYGYTFSLIFYHYSDTVNNCFGAESFNATAGIEVDFFAPTLQLVNGSRPIGSWVLNDPSIYALSPGKIIAEEDQCSIA